MPALHRRLMPLTLLFALSCQNATTPATADIATDTADACGEPIAAVCKIDNGLVDCNVALYDRSVAKSPWGQAMSPRAYCQSLCDGSAEPMLNGQSILADKTACGHMNSIQGLTCADCCKLADHAMPVYCDDDPCTDDACEGATCTHTPWGWIGQDCSLGACNGKYVCDKEMCGSCTPSTWKVCAPCEGDAR